MNITKRCFVRLVSFIIAIIAVLGAYSISGASRITKLENSLTFGYLRAVEELSGSLDNISTTLNKGLYAGTPQLAEKLAAKLWSDASNAKLSLSQLPVAQLNLESTNKFLSQVGNYAKSLSEKAAGGERISDDERANLSSLFDYSQTLSDKMWQLESAIQSGTITFDETARLVSDAGGEGETAAVTDGFSDIENGFDNYPTLIYDGPFSDHIMQKEPELLKGAAEVTQERALELAVDMTGAIDLTLTCEEAGKMPSFCFAGTDTSVAITRAGGYMSYMLRYRETGEKVITIDKALENAKRYLYSVGIGQTTDTYYELRGNVCIFNFAGVQDGVTLYTDLIKVGVALDNGEIMSYDARGYLTNHHVRELPELGISRTEAAELIAKGLDVKGIKLCVIPSDGLNERYCYELSCVNEGGQNILVYINAVSGREEQLLILEISEDGVLTV